MCQIIMSTYLYGSVFKGLFLIFMFSSLTKAQSDKGPHAYIPAAQKLHVVMVQDVVLHDSGRNKDLHLNVAYPDVAGKYPVIVFSHGAGGSREGYQYLTRYWASYGYVVIQPSHADSIALQRASGNQQFGLEKSLEQATTDPEAQQNRPKDISFILNSLTQLQKKIPGLQDKLDTQHIGVGGHSFGAFTSLAIAGATLTIPGKSSSVDLSDKRVSAVLAISAQGSGAMGLTENSWKGLRLPMMFMTGSRDFSAGGHLPEWRTEAFRKSPAGDKYLVFIQDAAHMNFAGMGATEDLRQGVSAIAMTRERHAVLRDAQVASLAFWNAYLKKDRSALDYLRSDELMKMDERIRFEQR
jgi:predicted dienelactone hydrolase